MQLKMHFKKKDTAISQGNKFEKICANTLHLCVACIFTYLICCFPQECVSTDIV